MSGGWQIRNIYLYLVSFVTLLILIFGLVAFLGNIADFIFPTDYQGYITLMEVEAEFNRGGQNVESLQELDEIRQGRMDNETSRNQIYRIRRLVSSLATWLVALPFYLYHWKKIKIELLGTEGGISNEA